MNATASLGVLEVTTVLPYLRERGLVGDVSTLRARELAGGVSSVVIEVEGPSVHLIVKQTLQRLRVAVEWLAKPERIMAEARGLELAGTLTPTHAPRIVDIDDVACVIVLEPAPREWSPWKQRLFDGTAAGATARGLGQVLCTWQCMSVADSGMLAPFADQDAFVQLRVEPFYRTVAKRHEALAGQIETLVDRMGTRRVCFVHGDFSPKNVLSGADGFWVIDFEVCDAGDPVFDVAFMLHHLILKAIHTGEIERVGELAREFVDGYRAAECTDVFDDLPYLGAHVGCLLLARVDGKSPADYLTAGDQEAARAEGIQLLSGAAGTFDAFWTRTS